jgi:multisubunit Na+/H+ antiporter MnhF subunit
MTDDAVRIVRALAIAVAVVGILGVFIVAASVMVSLGPIGYAGFAVLGAAMAVGLYRLSRGRRTQLRVLGLAGIFLAAGGVVIAAAFAIVLALKVPIAVVVIALPPTLWALLAALKRVSPRG